MLQDLEINKELKVVSRHRSTAVDSALKEDVSGISISQSLRRKDNIDPLFAKSPIVIEIADNDDQSFVFVCYWCVSLWTGSHIHFPFVGIGGRSRVVPTCVSSNYPKGTRCSFLFSHGERFSVYHCSEERRKFDERYIVLYGEKTVMEAQVATLDGEVNILSQQVQNLVSEKVELAECLTLQDNQFTAEVSSRKILEADLAWVPQKGVVRMLDRVVESSEFVLRIPHVRAAGVAVCIKKGKQMARAWLAGNIPSSSNPDAATQYVDAMHAAIRAFA
uniref:Uncharacterized protein n=1 Tax=Lactuca sativa TaxID=4236 RepID=A0A9R1VDL8_LACSA|nr:hypothetical protein LSAT_V11C500252000 [Lactuca sativa]